MNTGRQDRKIKFISLAGVDDGYGGTVPGRTTLLETFAQVNQIRSSSALEDLQNVLNDAYRFTVKWRSGFDPGLSNVIEYNGIDLTIQQVELNNERLKRFWTVMAINTSE